MGVLYTLGKLKAAEGEEGDKSTPRVMIENYLPLIFMFNLSRSFIWCFSNTAALGAVGIRRLLKECHRGNGSYFKEDPA